LAVGAGFVFPLVVFGGLLLKGTTIDSSMLIVVLGAPVASLTSFGVLNVAASGQAAKVEIAKATSGTTVVSGDTDVIGGAG
jgi:hypothetical protein